MYAWLILFAVIFVFPSCAKADFPAPNPSAPWRIKLFPSFSDTEFSTRDAAALAQCVLRDQDGSGGAGAPVSVGNFVAQSGSCGAGACPGYPASTNFFTYSCFRSNGWFTINAGDIVYQMGRCATGSTETGGVCVPTACLTNEGKETEAEVSWVGGADPNPTQACIDGCVATFSSGNRLDVTLATGVRYNSYKGTAVLARASCESGVRAGTALGAWRTSAASGGTNTTGIGGVGTGGATTADGINLAKIASNTNRIADLIANGAGTGGSGGEGGAACGGSGQPACAVNVAGDGLPEAEAVMSGTIDGKRTALNTAMDSQIASLDYTKAPRFDESHRWIFSFDALIGPSASICSHTWTANFPVIGPKELTLDICPWAPYARAFLFWVLMLYTAWCLWTVVYDYGRVQSRG